MIHKAFNITFFFSLLCMASVTLAQKSNDISMFPKAEKGKKMIVINLPEKKQEELFQIELIGGKNKEVDCNSYGLEGSIEQKELEGWGYYYYDFTTEGRMMGTLIACPDVRRMKFIVAPSKTIAYNSRIPIVMYIPEGYEVKYRIWSAGNEINAPSGTDQIENNSKEIKVTGKLTKSGMTTYQYGTHTIGKYAVKSSTVDLKVFEGKKVTLIGKKVAGYPVENGPELLEITSIKTGK